MDMVSQPTARVTLVTVDRAQLGTLLARKLQNVPEHVLPDLTIDDILTESSSALYIPTIPKDIQLPFFLSNRGLIDQHRTLPVKDDSKQSLNVTRAIFFYRLDESHQFRRYHDPSRWNLALFCALLHDTERARPEIHPSREHSANPEVSPAAKRFMTCYIAAVMECHNAPTMFEKREEFIRRWKESNWEMFSGLGASQKKFMRRQMIKLSREWEEELDKAISRLGRDQYDAGVAPFVGSVIPGRKDQGLQLQSRSFSRAFNQSASSAVGVQHEPDTDKKSISPGKNELLDALCVPVPDMWYYQENVTHNKDATTPSSLRYALTCVREVRPADLLATLMRIFPLRGCELAMGKA